jgi:hypothetical protein
LEQIIDEKASSAAQKCGVPVMNIFAEYGMDKCTDFPKKLK